MIASLALVALCSVVVPPAVAAAPSATTVYVATTGNDAWSGKLPKPNAGKTDGPLATLAGAREALRRLKAAGGLQGPVQVEVLAGTYPLAEPFVLEPQDSGAAGCPITYVGSGTQKPVLSGGRVLNGWRQQAKGLWVAEVPAASGGKWRFRQLWVNGKRATLARSPNEGYFRISGKAAPLTDPATGKEIDSSKSAFRFKPGDLKQWPDVTGANAVVFYHWETGMLPVKSVDEATGTVVFTGEMKWPFWGRQRYYLENLFEALDAPGEWYLDSEKGLLYYRPRPGENIKTAVVVAPKLTELVRFAGDPDNGKLVERVGFKGLSFQHVDYALEPEGHCDWQAACTVAAAIQGRGASECSLEQCEIAHLGNYAVWFDRGCKGNRIVQNHLHDLGAGGVRIGEPGVPQTEAAETSGNVVSNNFIHDSGLMFYGAIGVWIGQSSDNVIAHNEICDQNYTAISCGWTWGYGPTKAHRNRIEYNYLHHLGRGKLCDMGAIYTLGTSPGTVIRGNLIHDVWDWDEGYGAGGIYPDEGSSQILIENNVVYRTASGGLTVHYGKDNIARNNVFALGRDSQVHLGRSDKESSLTFERNVVYYDEGALFMRESTLQADNNLYFRTDGTAPTFLDDTTFKEWRAKGYDAHSVIADPKFVDAKQFDFRLKPDSPALKLGFQQIDVSQAGLTGPADWVRLPRAIKRPVTAIPRRAQAEPVPLDDDFELTPLRGTADNAVTYGETDQASIRVTDEVAAGGKRSLKFVDAAGLDQIWNPHLFFSPHFVTGVVENGFDLRLEKGATVWVEWRDASSPYRVGPSLGVDADGNLKAHDQELLALPAGQWVHFEIACGLGKQATGTFDLTVTVAGQPPKRFDKLPCDPKCKELQWLGFISNATDHAVFYLDNLKLHTVKPTKR